MRIRLFLAFCLGRPLIAYRYVEIMGVSITCFATVTKRKDQWVFVGHDDRMVVLRSRRAGGTGILWTPLNAQAREMELDL